MDPPFSKTLEIFIHHATNIHNICIYDNQDVYAKFSLTFNPDHTLSTHIINGGGKNPQFNQKLSMKIPTNNDSVLKCEIWMLSRAPNFMEDQLLGFALVPISQISDKEKITKDYNLSSTDLFHSPAGTVKLTLFLNNSAAAAASLSLNMMNSPSSSSSIASEVVLLDRKSEEEEEYLDYSRIEFPDINVVKENQKMVSEYFDAGAFLHLGAGPRVFDDCEMSINSPNSGFLSSTTTSLSDEMARNSSNATSLIVCCPDTPTSKKVGEVKEGKEGEFSTKIEAENSAEQSAMQKQIVDMYMRSMQQFTESLAKMKLPMDLDGDAISVEGSEDKLEVEKKKKKKDGSRVFYGSRAFF